MFAFRAPRVAAVLVAAALGCGAAGAAPDAELWERWTAHDPAAEAAIDHAPWDRLLARYVSAGADGVNRFAYGRVTAADRAALDAYVAGLAGRPIGRFARPEQAAYWINLYNALTVRVVLDHYPVDSIRDIDISPGFFSDGPWGAEVAVVDGEAVTLDDIEHRILRPIWRDARHHYVLNCAAVGCPQIAATAYRSGDLDARLDDAARAFVNHPRGVAATARGLRLSKVYDWYEDDFGDREALLAHLAAFASPPLAAALADSPRIAGYDYDWTLNDAAGAAPASH